MASIAESPNAWVDARIAGDPQADKPLWSLRDHTTPAYTRNPNSWVSAADLSCAAVWGTHGPARAGTLITPSVFITAAHYGYSVGDTIRFIGDDGTVHDRTVTAVVAHPDYESGTLRYDVRLHGVATPLPPTVTPAILLPAAATAKLPDYRSDPLMAVVKLDAQDHAIVAEWRSNPTVPTAKLSFAKPNEEPRLSWYEPWVGGDSSDPCFLLGHGVPILLGVASTSNLRSAAYATPLHLITAWIDTACQSIAGEPPTYFDVAPFDDYTPPSGGTGPTSPVDDMPSAKRIPRSTADLDDFPALAEGEVPRMGPSGLEAATFVVGTGAGEIVRLDPTGKLPASVLPALARREYLGEVTDESAMLGLVGQPGDFCKRADDGKLYELVAEDPTEITNWLVSQIDPPAITSIDGLSGGTLSGFVTAVSFRSQVKFGSTVLGEAALSNQGFSHWVNDQTQPNHRATVRSQLDKKRTTSPSQVVLAQLPTSMANGIAGRAWISVARVLGQRTDDATKIFSATVIGVGAFRGSPTPQIDSTATEVHIDTLSTSPAVDYRTVANMGPGISGIYVSGQPDTNFDWIVRQEVVGFESFFEA